MTTAAYRAYNEPSGWSIGVLRRDVQQLPYAMLLSDQHGRRIIETTHRTLSSLRMEVEVTSSRIREGKPNAGGQIPTTIDVQGVAENEWRSWIAAL